MATVEITYDSESDVLYAKRISARIAHSREAMTDSFLVLNLDESDEVAGVQLIAVREMPADFWLRHPDRVELSSDLLEAIDRWFEQRHCG